MSIFGFASHRLVAHRDRSHITMTSVARAGPIWQSSASELLAALTLVRAVAGTVAVIITHRTLILKSEIVIERPAVVATRTMEISSAIRS